MSALWHVTMSLDGFIAGPDDEMDWAFEHSRPGPGIRLYDAADSVRLERTGLSDAGQITDLRFRVVK
jgi:hypothetical protein